MKNNSITSHGKTVAIWTGVNIYDLIRVMDGLSDLDMDSLPHEDQIPTVLLPHTDYPIWACDTNNLCLVGESADEIEHADDIIEYLGL